MISRISDDNGGMDGRRRGTMAVMTSATALRSGRVGRVGNVHDGCLAAVLPHRRESHFPLKHAAVRDINGNIRRDGPGGRVVAAVGTGVFPACTLQHETE